MIDIIDINNGYILYENLDLSLIIIYLFGSVNICVNSLIFTFVVRLRYYIHV